MTCFVKDIKPSREFLDLTGNEDYFIIRNVFVGHTEEEKKIRLLKSLFMLTKPCQSTDDIKSIFLMIQNIISEHKLENDGPDRLISNLLPKLETVLECEFVILKNNTIVKQGTNQKARSKIFVVIHHDLRESVDSEIEMVYNAKTYDLSLLISGNEFEKALNHTHNHEIDGCISVEMFPLDFSKDMKTHNICRMDVDSFSPLHQMANIQKNVALANTKHSPLPIMMNIKKLCGFAKNFGYLNEDLPIQYFEEFLGEFFWLFKDDIEKVGYTNFVFGEFKKTVETLKNNYKQKLSQVTIHEEFIYSCYPLLNHFIQRFKKYASFENGEKVLAAALTSSLTKEQRRNRDLVKYYQDICNNPVLKNLVKNTMINWCNVNHDNDVLVHHIKEYSKENAAMNVKTKAALTENEAVTRKSKQDLEKNKKEQKQMSEEIFNLKKENEDMAKSKQDLEKEQKQMSDEFFNLKKENEDMANKNKCLEKENRELYDNNKKILEEKEHIGFQECETNRERKLNLKEDIKNLANLKEDIKKTALENSKLKTDLDELQKTANAAKIKYDEDIKKKALENSKLTTDLYEMEKTANASKIKYDEFEMKTDDRILKLEELKIEAENESQQALLEKEKEIERI
jgi:hypothetical protein